MKFPSINLLVDKALTTAKRFPLVLLCALIGTGTMIYMIDVNPGKELEGTLTRIVLACTLGLTLFLSLTIFMEIKKYSPLIKSTILLTGIVLLIVYYFSLPAFGDFYLFPIYRHILFAIVLHLVVSFIPFLSDSDTNGFWQYNKILFIRILTAILYSGVLFVGLVLAFLAVDNLFNIHIDGERYGELWVFLVGIFNTWFFLAGVPVDFESLKTEHSYPKGLKVFTQYVLLPLVLIYLVILYAYELKILISWSLPHGWVSYLVIAFSIAGILSLLLIYPVQNQKENSWIKTFSRWFYFAIFPLIVLLLLAIGKRLTDYGITEERYFVLALALWLSGIALYFTFSKMKNIKIIPISLCVIVFLSSIGPWSAFSISKISQKHRFEKIFKNYDLLRNGKIEGQTSKIKEEDVKQISSMIDFFDERRELKYIRDYFPIEIDTIIAKDSTGRKYNGSRSHEVMELVGLKYVSPTGVNHNKYYYFNSEAKAQFDIKGYEYYLECNYSSRNSSKEEDSTLYQCSFDDEENLLTISDSQRSIFENIELENFIKGLAHKHGEANYSIPQKEMILLKEGKNFSLKIFVRSINLEKEENNLKVTSIDARVLIKSK